MISKGRVCVKTAGREAGNICVVVAKVDDAYVLVEGLVKRRKCNLKHLEPLPKTVKVTKSSTKKEVLDSLVELKLASKEDAAKFLAKKPKPSKEKPVKKRKKKEEKKKKVKKKVKKKKVEKKKVVKKKAEKKPVKKPAKKPAKKPVKKPVKKKK